jgi:hypothetical protein
MNGKKTMLNFPRISCDIIGFPSQKIMNDGSDVASTNKHKTNP